jgi:hypothetical protein
LAAAAATLELPRFKNASPLLVEADALDVLLSGMLVVVVPLLLLSASTEGAV